MTLSQKQLEVRRRYLGASDSPAILGLSPFATPADVYWSKILEVKQDGTEATSVGEWLESSLVHWAADEIGAELSSGNLLRVAKDGEGKGIFAAHPDGLVKGKKIGIEAKYASSAQAHMYGEPGTDDIPNHVIVQAQHQMYAADLDCVYVAVAVASYSLERRLYCVRRDGALIDMIVSRGTVWWREHVEAGVVPGPTSAPPFELLRRLDRKSDKVVECEQRLLPVVESFENANMLAREASIQRENQLAQVLDLLGDGEVLAFPDGTTFVYREEKGPWTCDRTRLWAEIPKSKDYFTQGTRRVPRVKRINQITGESDG